MRNKLSDLNDHLFAQLERLSDEEMTAEDIEREVQRSQAMVAVADQITGNSGAARVVRIRARSEPMTMFSS